MHQPLEEEGFSLERVLRTLPEEKHDAAEALRSLVAGNRRFTQVCVWEGGGGTATHAAILVGYSAAGPPRAASLLSLKHRAMAHYKR